MSLETVSPHPVLHLYGSEAVRDQVEPGFTAAPLGTNLMLSAGLPDLFYRSNSIQIQTGVQWPNQGLFRLTQRDDRFSSPVVTKP